ncbi:MAG: hypothetical protein MZV63_66015 [Marinilabiliales bacterium]|nr:hypothetical protein [Marinilabiliales bacterium]
MRMRTGWARALARAAVRTRAGSNAEIFAWAMAAPCRVIVYRKYTIKGRPCQEGAEKFSRSRRSRRRNSGRPPSCRWGRTRRPTAGSDTGGIRRPGRGAGRGGP